MYSWAEGSRRKLRDGWGVQGLGCALRSPPIFDMRVGRGASRPSPTVIVGSGHRASKVGICTKCRTCTCGSKKTRLALRTMPKNKIKDSSGHLGSSPPPLADASVAQVIICLKYRRRCDCRRRWSHRSCIVAGRAGGGPAAARSGFLPGHERCTQRQGTSATGCLPTCCHSRRLE